MSAKSVRRRRRRERERQARRADEREREDVLRVLSATMRAPRTVDAHGRVVSRRSLPGMRA